jgi:hypothetical protein
LFFKNIKLNKKTYLITNTLNIVKHGTIIKGSSNNSILYSTTNDLIFIKLNADNIILENFMIQGNETTDTIISDTNTLFNQIGILNYRSQNIIKNVKIYKCNIGFLGDSQYLTYCNNCEFYYCRVGYLELGVNDYGEGTCSAISQFNYIKNSVFYKCYYGLKIHDSKNTLVSTTDFESTVIAVEVNNVFNFCLEHS